MTGRQVAWKGAGAHPAMPTQVSPARLRALLLALPLVLGACSGGDSPTDAHPPAPPPAVGAVAFVDPSVEGVVGSALTVQVRVDNVSGQPMANQAVTFSATAGSVTPTSAVTNASGMASVSWTLGTGAGTQTLTATAGGRSSSASVTAAPGPAASFERVSGDAQTGAAGEQLPQPLVVSVKDQHGNPRSGEAVSVSVTAGGGAVGSASAATGGDGRVSVSWTLGEALGDNAVTVTHALGVLTFSATARPGAPAKLAAISGGGQTAAAGTGLANPLVVEVRDRLDHRVPGAKVAFVVTAGSGSPAADTVVTDSLGRAQTTWTVGTTAGPQALEARVGGAAPVAFPATAVAGPAASLALASGGEQSGTVGQNLAQAVVVQVSDAFGNGVSGVTVTFSTANPGGQATPVQGTTGGDGRFGTTWKLGTTAGPQSLTAASDGLSSVAVAAQAAPGPPSQVRAAAGTGQTAAVAQAVPNPLVAEVVDAFGNPVPGAVVTFAPTTGSGSVSPGSATAGADGRASTAWTLGTTSGAQSVTASVQGAATATFTATATPGPARTFVKVSGDAQSGPAQSPLASPLVVAARDTFGNGVPGVAVAFAVTAGGGSLAPASTTTGSDGTASTVFTLGSTVGQHAARAAAGALGTLDFTATATSGPPAAIVKVSGDGQTRTVGDTVRVTVEVTDQFGNKVPNAGVTFAVVSGGGSLPATAPSAPSTASSAVVTTDAQGRASSLWTLGTTAGVQTLSATVAGVSPTTFTATGLAGAPASLAKVAGDNQSATVGTAVSTPPRVKVADSFGNGVPGVTVTFAVASGGGSVTGPTPTTGADGTAAVGSWTLGPTAGANTLTATAGGLPSVTFTATGTAAPAGGFNIEIRVVGSMAPGVQAAFAAAKARWERVITGDLPNASLSASQVEACAGVSEALTVEDVAIYAKVGPIDGPGNILGQAGPCYVRSPSYLPILGIMEFDEADLANMEASGILGDVILHEMGHVLGIGTLWSYQSLLQGEGGADPYFSGPQAVAAYQGLGATVTNGVPVENTGGGGTRDSHWRETTFGNELMTGWVNAAPNPLSIVTVRSLADQGYTVNPAAADAYALPSPAPLRAPGVEHEHPWEILRGPIGAIGPDGVVTPIPPRTPRPAGSP